LGKVEDLTADEATRLFVMIGLGALKYFLLKVDPKKRMLFDPNESIQLQGHTGPFIQYTHARIQALLRKSQSRDQKISDTDLAGVTSLETAERQVIFALSQFPQKLQEAAREYSPSIVANYAFDLAKEYNQFYQSIPIFAESDENKLKFRLALSYVTGAVLKKAMGLLGIDVPEKM
jgi:arginyl-tRNA synthetase